jgi:hypothetical protein
VPEKGKLSKKRANKQSASDITRYSETSQGAEGKRKDRKIGEQVLILKPYHTHLALLFTNILE